MSSASASINQVEPSRNGMVEKSILSGQLVSMAEHGCLHYWLGCAIQGESHTVVVDSFITYALKHFVLLRLSVQPAAVVGHRRRR
jgi:hypothetical protein